MVFRQRQTSSLMFDFCRTLILCPSSVRSLDSFPQTQEFQQRIRDLLLFLLPQFEKEGKSYLTVAFGCTGGQHRSVALAEDMGLFLSSKGYSGKVLHRDMPR